MAVKNLAFNIFSAVFAVTVVLVNWLSWCVLRVVGGGQKKSSLAQNIINRWGRVAKGGKREILEYLQIVVNIAIGVLFSKALLPYHCYVIETIVTITYELHLLSLNWAVDLPDYSAFLKDSEAVRMITVLFYLIFGFVGLSTQIAFTLDLISLFSYPFRAMKRFTDRANAQLLHLKDVMISILTIKRKYWVTCPYPEYLLNDTFKVVYVCALPLVFYLIFLTKAYSLFMGALILLFKTTINLGTNVSLFLEELGRIACTLAGLDLLDEDTLCCNQKSVMDRMQSVSHKLSQVDWILVFKWKKIKDTFTGSEAEPLQYEESPTFISVSILSVYESFSLYIK